MKPRRTRYAVIALVALACRGAQDSSVADTSVVVAAGRGARQATPGANPGDSATASVQSNPSLDPTDTVPVRRAPSTTQSIIDTASLTTIQKIVAHHPQHVDSGIL